MVGSDGLRSAVKIDAQSIASKIAHRVDQLEKQRFSMEKELNKCRGSEEMLAHANALAGNRHLYVPFSRELQVPDWSRVNEANNGKPPEVTVELDPEKNFEQNRDALFLRYRKAKRAYEKLTPRIDEKNETIKMLTDWKRQIEHILVHDDANTVVACVEKARGELEALGVRVGEKKSGGENKKAGRIPKPKPNPFGQGTSHFKSPSGYDIVAGRNASANEKVTFEVARSPHPWFHVRGYPGSHVVIRADWSVVKQQDIHHAASIAAYYSPARDQSLVRVSYCRAGQIRRSPACGKKGSVILTGSISAVSVTPSLEPPAPQGELFE